MTFTGSVLWELAGETTPPSENDQIASGIGGSVLGEPLFRLAELILRRSDHRFWRELSELAFDYFDLRFTSSTASRFENIFTRGLLAGRSYGEGGDRSRGVWGLYGGYDYVSPRIFRVSSVALSVGNTAQWKAGGTRAIQSTVLAGIGYGASGGFVSSASTDYHYGLTPQVLGAVRFIPGDRIAVDLTLRDYYVSQYAAARGGSENIARADALFSFRFTNHHAASIRYIWSRRATYGSDPLFSDVVQSRGSVGLFYTYLGGSRFGRVEF